MKNLIKELRKFINGSCEYCSKDYNSTMEEVNEQGEVICLNCGCGSVNWS